MSDSTNYGWVRLHRRFLKSDMWLSEPFTKGQAWVDLFANANHKDGTFWVRGNAIKVGRGQIAWSKLTMSDRWGWSEGKVDRFLEYLKIEEQIVVQTSSKTTLITLINYEKYQVDNRTNGEQTASRQGTNKNDKNDKNLGATAPLRVRVPDTDTPKKKENTKHDSARIAFSWLPNRQESWDKDLTQLSCGYLLFKRGEEAVRQFVKYVQAHQDDDGFNWTFVKPSDYERKWEDIKAYAKRNR